MLERYGHLDGVRRKCERKRQRKQHISIHLSDEIATWFRSSINKINSFSIHHHQYSNQQNMKLLIHLLFTYDYHVNNHIFRKLFLSYLLLGQKEPHTMSLAIELLLVSTILHKTADNINSSTALIFFSDITMRNLVH